MSLETHHVGMVIATIRPGHSVVIDGHGNGSPWNGIVLVNNEDLREIAFLAEQAARAQPATILVKET